MEEKNNRGKSEIHSKAVRAGKRTYFFDVKSTKDGNLYLTITESKRKLRHDGNGFYYEKHKVFLYKEDFIKFSDGLSEMVEYIRENNPTPVEEQTYTPNPNNTGNNTGGSNTTETKTESKEETKEETKSEEVSEGDFSSDVSFEDLDK